MATTLQHQRTEHGASPTMRLAEALDTLVQDRCRSGSRRTTAARPGRRTRRSASHLRTERGLAYLLTAPGSTSASPGPTSAATSQVTGVHPGDPYDVPAALAEDLHCACPTPRSIVRIARRSASRDLRPAAAARRRRRCPTGAGSSRACGTPGRRDTEAIHHHYDVSNTFYEYVLGPSMTYTCAGLPDRRTRRSRRRRTTSTTWSPASSASSRACGCSTSAAAGAGWSATRPALRRARRSASRCRASRPTWAQETIKREGLDRPRRGAAPRLPRGHRDRLRRGQLDRPHRAHRGAQLPGVLRASCATGCAPAAGCSTTASPGRTTSQQAATAAASSTATSSPTAS